MTDYNNLQLQDDYPRKIVRPEDKPMNALEILDKMIDDAEIDDEISVDFFDGLHAARDAIAQADDVKNAARYERVRKMSPAQFKEVFDLNIKTGIHFDHLIDQLIATGE